jgi:hypothetical protein
MNHRAGVLAAGRPRRDIGVCGGFLRRSAVVGGVLAVAVLGVAALSPVGSSAASTSASTAHGWSSVPLAARAVVSAGLGGDRESFFARRSPSGVVSLSDPPQGLHATFGGGGFVLSGADGLRLGLSGVKLARSGTAVSLSGFAPAVLRRNKVSFVSTKLSEWFASGPLGIEQGFTLSRRDGGRGLLTVSQTLSANAAAHLDATGQSVTLSTPGGSLTYGQLVVTDATGARIPARMSVSAHRLTITINDVRAVYPLRIDPEFQQTAELTASDGASGDGLGGAVAISGSTIIASAPSHTVGSNAQQGAVYVYAMPATGGWADATQTAELTASDGSAGDSLGTAVAISGSTVVASAPNRAIGPNLYQGAVYVYTKPASGWASTDSYTAELTASDGGDGDALGDAVAVSGSMIVAGAEQHNATQGALYVYTEPASGWASTDNYTAELSASDGVTYDDLGNAVAMSGTTIVAGAYNRDNAHGAVYVYSEPAGGWVSTANFAAELTASDGASPDELGTAVAVSGSTIVAGAPYHTVGSNAQQGAVYVYTEPAGGWTSTANYTAELTASDGAADDLLGSAVAVSGATIFAGAPDRTVGSTASQGVLYTYSEPLSGWTSTGNYTAELSAADGASYDSLGSAVAVGGTVVAGAPYHTTGSNADAGVVYTFHAAVTSSTTSLALSQPSITANGTSTSTATFTVDDTSGNSVTGDTVTITSAGGQQIGPVTAGTTPGTYQATITSTTTPGAATITATDTTVSPNAATTAVLTQTAAPAVAPSSTGPTGSSGATGATYTASSNAFTITDPKGESNGTITLEVRVPEAGTIELLGTHEDVTGARMAVVLLKPGHDRFEWGRAGGATARAATMRMVLRPDSAGRRLLARHRKYGWALHVCVWTTYTPAGGHSRSVKTIILVLAARKAAS